MARAYYAERLILETLWSGTPGDYVLLPGLGGGTVTHEFIRLSSLQIGSDADYDADTARAGWHCSRSKRSGGVALLISEAICNCATALRAVSFGSPVTWSIIRRARSSAGDTSVSKYAHGYDDLARRTHVIRTGAAFTLNSGVEHSDVWNYNDRNELTVSKRYDDTSVPLSSGADTPFDRDYAYDPIGNRTSYDEGSAEAVEYYCVNNVNQYTSIDDASTRVDVDARIPA